MAESKLMEQALHAEAKKWRHADALVTEAEDALLCVQEQLRNAVATKSVHEQKIDQILKERGSVRFPLICSFDDDGAGVVISFDYDRDRASVDTGALVHVPLPPTKLSEKVIDAGHGAGGDF